METTALPRTVEPGEIVYRDRNQFIQRVVATFDGFTKEYFVSDHGVRAALLAVADGRVLFTRQYRLLINAVSFEIPGGRVDRGESPDAAAIRECLEETSVLCAHLKPLIRFQPSLDIWNNDTHVFFSDHCETAGALAGDRAAWIPLVESLDMVFDGRIADSLSVTALLAYHARQRGWR